MQTTHDYRTNSSFADPKEVRRLERKIRSLCLLCRRKLELNFLLALTALMLSAGFLFAQGTNQNYSLIYDLMSPLLWSFSFLIYSAAKFYQTYVRSSNLIKCLIGSVGIWLWTLMFLSFSVFDSTPIAPAESLILVFAFVEVWVLVSVIDICGDRRSNRNNESSGSSSVRSVFFRRKNNKGRD